MMYALLRSIGCASCCCCPPTPPQCLRRPNPAYLEKVQGDMNSKMRAILVDWLVEVAEEYKLCADTL